MIRGVTTGELLRVWRKAIGKTQEQFADAAGIARSWVGNFEKDRSSPNVRTLLKFIGTIERFFGPLGQEEHEKLSRFFRGPDYDDLLERAERLGRDLARIRKGPAR